LFFGLMLAFGWRGLLWVGLIFVSVFAHFFGWRATALDSPYYLISYTCAFLVARAIARREPWLSRERSTLAVLSGAFLAPSIPALLSGPLASIVGFPPTAGLPALMNWLRETAGILVVAPALLVYSPGRLRKERRIQEETKATISAREALELAIELAAWTVAFYTNVHLRSRYNINAAYLTFVPPLVFTLRHGMRASVLALALNAVVATGLWQSLHWSAALSIGDLRVLIATYSTTILVLAAVVDERRRASEQRESLLSALGASEEKFAAAFYNAPLFLMITDLEDGRLLEVNDTFLERTGYSRPEVVGKTIVELGFNTAESRTEFVKELTAKGRITGIEVPLRTKSGEPIPCLFGGAVVPGQGQKRIIAILDDIGEQKRARENTAKLERQLQQAQKMETLGRFAAGIAHDFNNLLTVINGYGRIVYNKLPDDSSLRNKVGEICNAGMSAALLTEQLLAFSQRRKVPAEPLNLNDVAQATEEMLKRLLGPEVTLETELDPELRPVMATTGELQRILMNLAANARDAMEQKGTLRIRTCNAEARDPDDVSGFAALSCAVLEVRDTGRGIAPENLGKVFEPFFSTKEVHIGAGLGLAIVYGLVKQRGGWIETESRVGEGTTFRLFYPAAKEAPAGAPPPKTYRLAGGAGATILLAEDQPEVRRLASEILRSQGYDVMEAEGGEQALEYGRSPGWRIDLLVSDVVMPNMPGAELAKRLRASRASLPVLFISGYAPEERGGLVGPGTSLLSKPFSPEQLVEAVAAALSASRSEEARSASSIR
jgi:PAS domain S-box-containing protein